MRTPPPPMKLKIEHIFNYFAKLYELTFTFWHYKELFFVKKAPQERLFIGRTTYLTISYLENNYSVPTPLSVT